MKQIKWVILSFVFVIIFCASFVVFYTKHQAKAGLPTAQTAQGEQTRQRVLPEAKLVDSNSDLLPDEKLRKGKVVLIFVSADCEACLKESEFLSGLIHKRNDIEFYGVTSFGKPEETLKIAEKNFPFKVYFDVDSLLGLQLKIMKVPIKIYLEDGVIKKAWGGATIDEDKKSEFISWLESV